MRLLVFSYMYPCMIVVVDGQAERIILSIITCIVISNSCFWDVSSFSVAEVDHSFSSGHSKLHRPFEFALFTKKIYGCCIGAEKSVQLKTDLPTCCERCILNSLRTGR
jgi:hypothetical protein